MFVERRNSVRKRTFLKGRIFFNNGASSMDCLVRDLSSVGAKLELSETAALPEVFDLHIQNKDAKHRSTLRWRRDGAVGITFDEALPKTIPEPRSASTQPANAEFALSTLLRRISELEAENASLRSRLASTDRDVSSAA